MVSLAFGTQTAGSVIRPASFCGVFGLKPGHGTVSLAGAMPFAPSLDTLGWFARDANDLELMRCALAGVPFVPLDVLSASSLRIGVCRVHEERLLEAGGAQVWDEARRRVSASGAVVSACAMPESLGGLFEAQKTVMAYEAVRSLAREWRAHRARLSAPLQALLETGETIDDSAYRGALDLARSALPLVDDVMRDVDVLIVPAVPGEAPRGLEATGDPAFNRVWTLLGLPCVAVPGLRGPSGMPVGVQVVGRRGEESRLIAVAACLHRVLL
jgi:Asp-tRNA(Asn)/Glu-tRNA(Gln) amidotransferase A subunit family amidase